jgi:hypothetical protein
MATFQLSVAMRNARMNNIQSITGGTAVLNIYSGTLPANCASATTGTLLASIALPATFMASASGGAVSMTGTWQDLTANNTGTAAYFRIFTDSGAATCTAQGDCGLVGASPAMVLDNTSFVAGQEFNVLSFTLTDGNA